MCFESAGWSWEAAGVWLEAIALIAIFVLDWRERRDSRKEREEQRKARAEERQEREELRRERQELQEDRQRLEDEKQLNGVDCVGLRGLPGNLLKEVFCRDTWERFSNHQPGFAIEQRLHTKFPRYLEIACSGAWSEIQKETRIEPNASWQRFVVFKFPYPHYDAALKDVQRHFGEQVRAWDENGKPIEVERKP